MNTYTRRLLTRTTQLTRTTLPRTHHHYSNREQRLTQHFRELGNQDTTNKDKGITNRDKEIAGLYQELSAYHLRDHLLHDHPLLQRIRELEDLSKNEKK